MSKAMSTKVVGACLLAASSVLFAEGPRLGVQVLGSVPTGSMRGHYTTGTGVGLGVFADWQPDPGKVFRLGYDGVQYPNDRDNQVIPGVPSGTVVSRENHRKYRSHGVSLQYLYFPGNTQEGLYLMAGVGVRNDQTRTDSNFGLTGGTSVELSSLTETGTRPAYTVGLGYEFDRNWGASAKYSLITTDGHVLGAAQAGISYRF